MNYEEFKKELLEKIANYLPEEHRNLQPQIVTSVKTNQNEVEQLTFKDMNRTRALPAIRIENSYCFYQQVGDMDEVLKATANLFVEALEYEPNIPNLKEALTKENVIFHLINTELNKELLQDIPHREWNDLSIVYRFRLPDATALIHNYHANFLGFTDEEFEQELFNLAYENTKRLSPPLIKSLTDILTEVNEELKEELEEEEMNPMWMISNQEKFFGAGVMIYTDVLHELAEQIEDDLYIIPSSIHEVIAVPAVGVNAEQLAESIGFVNENECASEDVLSHRPYFYDRKAQSIKVA